jgi:alpha-L-arabinofuranosidase
MISLLPLVTFLTATPAVQGSGQAYTGSIAIHVGKLGHPISSNFYGLMTEEINHAYDGGLYAELIQNRSFRDNPDTPVHWKLSGGGKMSLEPGAVPDLKVEGNGARVELSNDGYWGIPVKPNTTYHATIRLKTSSDFVGPIVLSIENDQSQAFASAQLTKLSTDWNSYEISLRTGSVPTSKANRFVIASGGIGSFSVNYVSLFPPTFHRRPNGLRPDLMEMLSAMKPSFLRLPGGNYLEGNTVATRFNWKATLGKPQDRLGHEGPWGYRSSDGLGLLEFLEWCQDLKMEPVLAVYAGYSLGGEHVEAGAPLAPYVQDALDEIEYLTGDNTTEWGSRRIRDGHMKPFPLAYVEIGNEDEFDRAHTYDARFTQFFDAIRAKYPLLKLIATTSVTSRIPDVFDDHYYRSASEMAQDSGHYDDYPRTGPKIFVGEWASIEGKPTPNMQAALGDAAWLTGLERDSDLVSMESYAPLLVNVNPGASQWGTNLIGYDCLNSFGSPSYYVQSMFAQYTGKNVAPADVTLSLPPLPKITPHGAIGLGSWRTDVEYKDVEVTHNDETLYSKSFETSATGWKPVTGVWNLADGTFRQSSLRESTLATAGDPAWTDYTYRVKAKKLSGDEGFIVPFHVADDNNYWFWNVGGWGNTRSNIQLDYDGDRREVGKSSPVHVETGRWYDLKIELKGGHAYCYLDDKLVNEAEEVIPAPPSPIYVAASSDPNGALFLKVVNFSDSEFKLTVSVDGSRGQVGAWTGLSLAGDRLAVNTVSDPDRVSPTKVSGPMSGASIVETFPARSVTVLKGFALSSVIRMVHGSPSLRAGG